MVSNAQMALADERKAKNYSWNISKEYYWVVVGLGGRQKKAELSKKAE